MDAAEFGEFEKKARESNVEGFKLVCVERQVARGPMEPVWSDVYEGVYGDRDVVASLEALEALEAREAREAPTAAALEALLGRHGLEYRVVKVETQCEPYGGEPMWWWDTKRLWLKRGSETLAALDAMIARGQRHSAPVTPRLTPWEPKPVWEPPRTRSPRSPAYRPERLDEMD